MSTGCLLRLASLRRGEAGVVAAGGDAGRTQPLAGGLGLFAGEAVDLRGGRCTSMYEYVQQGRLLAQAWRPHRVLPLGVGAAGARLQSAWSSPDLGP